MKAIFQFFYLFAVLNQNILGQSAWEKVNTDINDPLKNICFVNQDTGFAHGPFGSEGKIYRTLNGGISWDITNTNSSNYLTSIFFINKNIGWIAGSNSESLVIYKTINGGDSWNLQYSNDSIGYPDKIFFSSPEIGWILKIGDNFLLKSVDGGDTWEKYYFNISSFVIKDFYFINDSVGFCCYEGIFKTIDGGSTWIKKQNRPGYGDFHCVYFYDDSVGFSAGGAIYKTEDVGETWTFRGSTQGADVEMYCIFINGNKGWVFYPYDPHYITLDSGETWDIYNTNIEPYGLMKFNFVNENIGYAINVSTGHLYKTTTGGIVNSLNENRQNGMPFDFHLYQNYPNPFNPSTTIKYNLQKSNNVTLKIYNLAGQEIERLVNGFQIASKHETTWHPKNLSSGIYFYRLQAGEYMETKKLILQK